MATKYIQPSEKEMKDYISCASQLASKYPSEFFHSVTIAQAILEPYWGQSVLAREHNNYFGYKAKENEWSGRTIKYESGEENSDGNKYLQESIFRSYDSAEHSFADHAKMMVRSAWYADYYKVPINAKTAKEQARGLTGTYATDSDYAKKLIEIMDKYDLYQYDKTEESEQMATHLIIAGHGTNPNNGYFDPGATGYVSMGEHRYMRDVLFPLMKKYTPDKVKAVYFSDYNVYSKGNLVSLAKTYGADTVVTEMHFDATSTNSASGGHVIVHKDFKADKVDLAIRDAIKSAVGLAYPVHLGDKGISGRSDLANPNRAANGGINYRLAELGFGTNQKDANYMLNQADAYAKLLCTALFGSIKSEANETPAELPGSHVVVHGEYLWLIAQKYGITVDNLRDWNQLTSNVIYTGQVLKVVKPDGIVEEGKPDPEVTEPSPNQPEDSGKETVAIDLQPGEFLSYDGKVYIVKEKENVYE